MRHVFGKRVIARCRYCLLLLNARLSQAWEALNDELFLVSHLWSRQLEAILVETDSTIAQYLQQVNKYDALAHY